MSSAPSPSASHSEPSTSTSTLYADSPHVSIDKRTAKRKLKDLHARHSYTDPFNVVLFILATSILYWLLPIPSPYSIYRRNNAHSERNSASPLLHCNCEYSRPMPWQKTITLNSRSKGVHLVSSEIESQIAEGLKGVKIGILTLFIQHTSAALTLNENYDPDVRKDMDMALDHIVPESLPFRHVDEGPDDSASHTKTALIGPSVQVPITDGKLNLGTWQGIYLAEFRYASHRRKIGESPALTLLRIR